MTAQGRADLNIEHQHLICLLVDRGNPDDPPALWQRLDEIRAALGITPYKQSRPPARQTARDGREPS